MFLNTSKKKKDPKMEQQKTNNGKKYRRRAENTYSYKYTACPAIYYTLFKKCLIKCCLESVGDEKKLKKYMALGSS